MKSRKDNVDGLLLQKAVDTAMHRYPYLKKRLIESTSSFHQVEIDMPGVQLAGSLIGPMEYDDPYLREIPESAVELPDIKQPTNVMYLPSMGLVRNSKTQIHHVRIIEKQLMVLCKSSDATPNTAITLLMWRAIHKLHPCSDKSMAAGIYCDLRSALQSNKTHKPIVTAPLLKEIVSFGIDFDLLYSSEESRAIYNLQTKV